MDGTFNASAIVAKQLTHARHGPIIQEWQPLSYDILEMSVVACFERQVALMPHRLAVQAAEGALTYDELNQAVNRLAHTLLAMGVDVNTPVTILLERSLNTVISLLAVLKTGGYYLCMEPTSPVPRTQDILTRAATQFVITISAHAAYAEEVAPAGSTLLLLDQLDQTAASESVHNPAIPIGPLQPARLGFTSGSTGAPKPSLKNHKNYLYSAWQNSVSYRISPGDRHAAAYPFSAGVATSSLLRPLFTGGSLHLYSGPNNDISGWADWIEAQEITFLWMPTVAFREMLHLRPDGANFPSLRLANVGGQTLYRQDAELFQRRFCRGAIMIVRYGMSEMSGLAHYLIDHDTVLEGETLPIGYALPGRELLVVDEEGHSLGFNQPGEIVVRNLFANAEAAANGPSMASGAQVADEESAMFFHTADVGLLRPDGCLIHLGRKDDMIKVRGNRVALAEAENLLMKVGGVAQASIKPFPTPSGDNRLVGYVTPIPGAQLTGSLVRKEMHDFAPTFMVPMRVVVMPTLPMSATGKVDRRALPTPTTSRPELETPYVAPSNEVEQQIADIWAELLDVDDIGIHDNFFELGGDSLTAMRMILRAEALTGATTPANYFRAPTIAALVMGNRPDAPVTLPPPSHANDNLPDLQPPSPASRNLFTRLTHGKYTASSLLNGLSRAMINQRLMGLSYTEGIRWLAWIGQPAIAQRVFRHERTWFYTLAQEVANSTTLAEKSLDNRFAVSVVGNLIRYNFQHSWRNNPPAHGDLLKAMAAAPERFWRSFAHQFDQAASNKRAPLFHVSGLEHLVHAQKRKKGTILLTYHSTASALANLFLARQTSLGRIPTISFKVAEDKAEEEWAQEWSDEEDRPEDEARLQKVSASWAATYALQAQRILQTGGVVRIINDMSYDTPNSIPKTVGRRLYHLKPGFVELALTAGATVLPVYSTFDLEGHIHLTILPALIAPPTHARAGGTGDHARGSVDNFLDQYVAFLESTWRNFPESIGWGSLQRYNNRPLAVRSSQSSFQSPQSAPAGRG